MGRSIREDDPNDRRWLLLARKRAGDLKAAIAARRAFVESQFQRIAQAQRDGRYDEAATIRDDLIHRYGKFNDLTDLLGTAADKPSPAPAPEPSSAPGASPDAAVVPPGAGATVP
jgi:hypothetical protein